MGIRLKIVEDFEAYIREQEQDRAHFVPAKVKKYVQTRLEIERDIAKAVEE